MLDVPTISTEKQSHEVPPAPVGEPVPLALGPPVFDGGPLAQMLWTNNDQYGDHHKSSLVSTASAR
jgi:hypothetical protein